jgi:tRNA G10  N-methylase Trm11
LRDEIIKERIDLALDLLHELKDLSEAAAERFTDIEKYSVHFYQGLFEQERSSIQDEIDKYKRNTEKITQLNYEIIDEINLWYAFAKDHQEIKQILFPLKFWRIQQKIKKKIKKLNQEIDRVMLENRFIKEKIGLWEQELENKALQEIKQGDYYQSYLRLIERKADVISHLKYLLTTLPLKYPIKLDLKKLNVFIDELRASLKRM